MFLIKAKQLISPCIMRGSCFTNISRHTIPGLLYYKLNEPPRRYFNWKSVMGFVQNPVVLAKKDGIPPNSDYQTVYNAKSMSFYLICANYYVVLTAFAGLAYLYSEFGDLTPIAQESPPSKDSFFKFQGTMENSFAIAATVLFNCGILYVVHRFPLRIYHSETRKNFIIVFNQILLPWRSATIKCNPGGVESAGESLFNNIIGNHKLGRKRLYLMLQYFRYPAWYNSLLGYSK